MSIECPNCNYVFKIRKKIKPGTHRARCSKCDHRFSLTIPQPDADLNPIASLLPEDLEPRLQNQLPTGCTANLDKCYARIQQFLSMGTNPEKAFKDFLQEFNNNPVEFVNDPAVLIRHRSSQLFEILEKRVSPSLPAGCELDRQPCVNFLNKLVNSNKSSRTIIDLFLMELGERGFRLLKVTSLRKLAEDIFCDVATPFNSRLPRGCQADKGKCVKQIELIVPDATGPEEVETRFVGRLGRTPAAFVDKPDVYCKRRGIILFHQIEPLLVKKVAGCRGAISEKCKTLMSQLLAQGVSEDAIVKKFMDTVLADAYTYLKLPPPRQLAKQIYSDIEQMIAPGLPAGCTLKKAVCTSAIATLVEKSISPTDVSQSFLKLVFANPEQYLAGFKLHAPPPDSLGSFGSSPIFSSAPRSMGRSEIRRRS